MQELLPLQQVLVARLHVWLITWWGVSRLRWGECLHNCPSALYKKIWPLLDIILDIFLSNRDSPQLHRSDTFQGTLYGFQTDSHPNSLSEPMIILCIFVTTYADLAFCLFSPPFFLGSSLRNNGPCHLRLDVLKICLLPSRNCEWVKLGLWFWMDYGSYGSRDGVFPLLPPPLWRSYFGKRQTLLLSINSLGVWQSVSSPKMDWTTLCPSP